MDFWRTLVGKLWLTISGLVACVLLTLGLFLLPYIDTNFTNSDAIKRLFTYVSIIGFALTTFFALFLLTKITQPMQQLIQATDGIRKGKYNTRLALRTGDEIGQLASAFNHMAEELEKNIQNLQLEKEQMASVLRSMGDGVITFDKQGNMILHNPLGEMIMDSWHKAGWEGQQDGSGAAASKVPEPLYPMFERVIRERQDQSSNIHVKQQVWAVNMTPLYSGEDVRGTVSVLRDVTEEVKAEKMRRDFVANVSHEIRTPLQMIQGYSEALLDGMASSPEESNELVQVIYDESLRMSRLVQDLLDLSRMEAGHTDMNFGQMNLNELMDRVYRKFSVRAKERELDLKFIRSEAPLLLEADADRLEQVFTNLLDNAFRHTQAGGTITVTAALEGNQIKVSFQDTGAGIPLEDLPFIFERFYKADKARVRGESGGTGLGLAIVRNIIEAHQGTIAADSQVGKGTVFTLTLPVHREVRE
ncbi:HAMP domain-containing sensor histidine kinase [Paenibacillus bovis]|uniref:histidine kinase n=1 Tax=Paenibacillus bovis TaxID=1616788 RepID=A0A172ZIK4_9BACL|nr:ATP-binding protein [Paenibacillus bovis]ANF97476.1 histidine kinase [Paenibacillus bovis]